MNKNFSLNTPFHQGISAFLLFITGTLVLLPLKSNFPEILARENAYVVHAVVLLIFAFINSVSIFNSANEKIYRIHSFYTFIILLISGIMISTFITGIGIKDTKSFSLIYPLLCGCYLVIFIVATLIKKILIYADQKP